MTLDLSPSATSTAGVLLLSILAVEWGGAFVLKVARRRQPATPFQERFYRAGHAHAGVLVTLGLIATVLTEATSLTGIAAQVARSGVPLAAVLMPAGFFLSAAGSGRSAPNRALVLIPLGAASLAAGVGTLGIGLLTA